LNTRDKSDLGSRLKRIAGQVAGIERMVDEDRPALDVITQVRAVRAALGSVTSVLLAAHVEERANEALMSTSQRERRELVGELVRLFQKRDS
jgi:CsoR family transcriptional regulator, copper-sensing transcriptional repressor